ASAPGTRDSGTESQAAAATAGLPPVDDSAVTADAAATAGATLEQLAEAATAATADAGADIPDLVEGAPGGESVDEAAAVPGTTPQEPAAASSVVIVSTTGATLKETPAVPTAAPMATAASTNAASTNAASATTDSASAAQAASELPLGIATEQSVGGPASEPGRAASTPTPTATAVASAPASAGANAGAVAVPAELKPVAAADPVAKPAVNVDGANVVAATAPATPAQASATAPAVAPTAPVVPPQLASQLSGQLTSLRALPQGEHVLTLTVNPEGFGPVKVVAHIGADGVHLELFGASEQARAALRAALPDLRRDLVGVGLDPRLDVGSGSSGDAKDQSMRSDREGFGQQQGGQSARGTGTTPAAASTPMTINPHRAASRGGLDLDL
ncbi:flagellar hook-length control protein FliK, partial [Demequina sp. TTPB684]